MKVLVDETIKPAIGFLNKIQRNSKVAIIHGHDNDSICSAAIIYKLIKQFHGVEPKFIVSELNFAVTENVLEKIKKIKPDYVIIVDIAEVNVSVLTGMRNIAEVMIIDHHIPRGYVKITYVNPRIYDKEAYLPATYITYSIYEKFLEPKDVLWVAGVGTLSDMGMKNCKDLFDKIKKNENGLVGNNDNIDEVLFDNSVLGRLAKILDSGRVASGIEGSVTALDALIKAKNYADVLEGKSPDSKKLLQWHAAVEKEFNKLVKDFGKNKGSGKLILYGLKSKYNIKSALATFLSTRLNDEVLIVYQKSGGHIDVSFRRGKKCLVDLSGLAGISVKGITGSNGGGHPAAAGARFPTSHLKQFLANLKIK